MAKFSTENGFHVTNMTGFGPRSGWEIGNTSLERVYQFVKSADTLETDGIFISCTAFPTVDILQALEEDLEKLVVSANQATIWKALAIAGVRESMHGLEPL